MPRKSSASPSGMLIRCQVFPLSVDFRITPLEPDAQMTIGVVADPRAGATTLTPRRFVSTPDVCTSHIRRSPRPAASGCVGLGAEPSGACCRRDVPPLALNTTAVAIDTAAIIQIRLKCPPKPRILSAKFDCPHQRALLTQPARIIRICTDLTSNLA